jgi:DNA-binding transcriptional LysR family regulator
MQTITMDYGVGMTLDQLEAFHAVATRGGFTAASAFLHKSQPAISKLIQNLESELGLALFDRASYRAALTDAGRLFLERAAGVLESSEALRRFGQALGGAAEPVIRLVVEAVTPLAGVIAALRDVEQRFPVRYELRTERLTGALEALRDRSADLAITTLHGVDPAAMTTQPFCSVRIIPVVGKDHALASQRGAVPPALLREVPQVVLRDSARGELTQTLNVLDGGLRWTVTDVSAKLEIIEAGLGWGGLPEHIVARALTAGTLVALDVREFHVRSLELCTIRRRDDALGPVAQALWSRLAPTEAAQGS